MSTASILASGLGSLGNGTLVSLIVRKKGVLRGPAGHQRVYDDDLVHVLLWSGFHYQALAARSYSKLLAMQGNRFYSNLVLAARTSGVPGATIDDACRAAQELAGQLRLASLSGRPKTPQVPELPEMPETSTSVWGPLVVNGNPIVGAKVYSPPPWAVKLHPNHPVPGTIYLDGVKLGEVVLNPAPNGHWEPQSSAKTIIKDRLESQLPCGKFVRYCLDDLNLLVVKTGKEASESARRGGIQIDPEDVRDLFKIAA
jgi:hypothetical protein